MTLGSKTAETSPKTVASPGCPYRLGDFLINGLQSNALSFAGASAFARRSGVRYIQNAIKAFSDMHPFRLTIGIDLRGTSVEALEGLHSSIGKKGRIYVFHNPNAVFHPKAYQFEYDDRWEAYIGSGNLTRSGLFENYEVGLSVLFSKGAKAEAAAQKQIGDQLRLWADTKSGSAKILSPDLIKSMRDCRLILPEAKIVAARNAASLSQGKGVKALFPTIAVPVAPPLPAEKPKILREVAKARPSRSLKMLTEADARLLMLRIAATMPGGSATTEEFIDRLPYLFPLSMADFQQSRTRKKQPRWHQIVRNVISHRDLPRGPFILGWAVRTADGLKVTRKGRKHLRDLGY